MYIFTHQKTLLHTLLLLLFKNAESLQCILKTNCYIDNFFGAFRGYKMGILARSEFNIFTALMKADMTHGLLTSQNSNVRLEIYDK